MTKPKSNDKIVELIGWSGAAMILLAYTCNSFHLIDAGGILFQLMNLFGALGVGVISLKKRAAQPAALNIIWALVAMVAILDITFSFL